MQRTRLLNWVGVEAVKLAFTDEFEALTEAPGPELSLAYPLVLDLDGTLLRTDHKAIGLLYLWLALFSVFLGMIMSLVMRIHLVWPGAPLPFLVDIDPVPYPPMLADKHRADLGGRIASCSVP